MSNLSGSEKRKRRAGRFARLSAAVRGGSDSADKVPTLTEFAEDLLVEVGGSRNLARMFVAEMKGAQGQSKQRLLDTFTRIITAAAKLEGQSDGELGDLTDEDVQLELQDQIFEVSENDDGEEDESDDSAA